MASSAFNTGSMIKQAWLALTAISMLSAASPGFAQPVAKPLAEKRVSPAEFALFPWDSLGTPEQVIEAYECGFNLAGFCDESLLDAVQQPDMQCFVRDPLIEIRGAETLPAEEITSRVRNIAGRTSSHPAVFGYHLLDEPRANLFPVIAKWVSAFSEAAPGKIAYTNLLPDYGGNLESDGPFERYVTNYVETVKPLAYSYDYYALMEGGGLRNTYFQNLEGARATSLKTGVPFWQIVLGNAHFNYAEPSPAGLRFQAYTSLAYGARGLGYFTFTARERGNYRCSALDAYGKRTPTFDMIRDVNLQVHRLAPALSKMKSVGIFHTPSVPPECKGIESSKFLEGMSGPGQYLVGEFESEEYGPAVLVVNTNLTTSTSFKPVPKIKADIQKISSTTGETLSWSAENNWLAPGQGMLLLLKEQ